jgi:tetratricopeptide (TPR) repeat protein
MYLLERGQAALAHGNWNQAERCLEILERRGYREHARLLGGEVSLQQARLVSDTEVSMPASPAPKHLHQALHELAQIKDEGPLALEAIVFGGECLLRLGERRFAAEILDSVLRQNPDHKEAHRWLAAIYIDLNSPSQAIAHLREWGRLEPRNGRPYRWIGLFLAKDYGNHQAAIEAYREACRRQLDPSLRAQAVKELAETLIDGPADYQAALDTLAQCPEALTQPEMLTLQGQCLWSLGRQAEAINLVETALRANPELPQALRLRASFLLADGQAGAAVPFLEKALRIDAHDHLGRQLLMQTYKQLGDNVRAEEQRRLLEATRADKDRLTQLHEAALQRPWDGRVRHELADLCLKLNRKAEAQMWRQAALACTPSPSAETAFAQPFSWPERN